MDLLGFPKLNRYNTSSLKIVESGWAHVSSELVRNAVAVFGSLFINNFGMAEGPVSYIRLDDPFETACDTVGRPCCADSSRSSTRRAKSSPSARRGNCCPGVRMSSGAITEILRKTAGPLRMTVSSIGVTWLLSTGTET